MDLGVAIRVYRLHWNCACILLLLGSSANNNCSKHSNMPSKNDNGSKKRGTATEHAKQPVTNGSKKRRTATEHATRWQPQDFGLNPNGNRSEVPGSSSTRENPAEPAPLTEDGADALFGRMRPPGMPRMFLANGSKKRGTDTEHAKQQNTQQRGTVTEHAKQQKRGTATEHDKQPVVMKPNAHTQQRGTATHHAKRQKRGPATEHAKQPVVLKPNAKTQQAMKLVQASRANNKLEHLLFLLADFLTMILRELWPSVAEKCEEVAFDKIQDWAENPDERPPLYNESELLVHKKLWDVIQCDVRGVFKEHLFVQWCRRIGKHRTNGDATNSASTENADNDSPYRRMVEDIFAHDLTPEQKKDPKYKLGKGFSTKQRSFVNSMLRKTMGDARVAVYILDRGLPALLDPPPNIKQVHSALLQNMLQEFMTWHGSLLRWLADKEKDPNTIMARKLSDLNLKEWQIERRRRKWEAQQELRQGAHLAELRDSNNKRFHDMSATEKRVLEDFDCGKLEKLHDDLRVLKPNHWG